MTALHSSFKPLPSFEPPNMRMLVLAAMGVVFGDIGTSPLYALKEAFDPANGVALNAESIFGLLSLLFWVMIIVVSLKYMLFVMRADNHGEGGVLALTALGLRSVPKSSKAAAIWISLGVFGACMFYGDAVITPAISMLSAVEGMQFALPQLSAFVLPIAVSILVALFWLQKTGTRVIGKSFGPIMLLWFLTLAILGVMHIVRTPMIMAALHPAYGIRFMIEHAQQAFMILGAVFLVLTGAEALYADMGHFGARPIRVAWHGLVMPALILNYFGQGALLLRHPEAIKNPFYALAPHWALMPLVVLATLAAVIASQAVISGAFSLTSQAIQLGYAPRMAIKHTSAQAMGQIYIPLINGLLLIAILCVVLGFKNSANLAAAYGIAVTTTMVITTLLACAVMLRVWRWRRRWVAPMMAIFLLIDMSFLGVNLLKISKGGWLPLAMGTGLFFLSMTWFKGRRCLQAATSLEGLLLLTFLDNLKANPPQRVAGVAVHLTSENEEGQALTPASLLHNLKHNKVLHERTFFLTFVTSNAPFFPDEKRLVLQTLDEGLFRIRMTYGFNETPDVQNVRESLSKQHRIELDWMETSFFIARQSIIPSPCSGMSLWRERLFAWMHRNAAKPSDFFRIPIGRVVELGTKVEI